MNELEEEFFYFIRQGLWQHQEPYQGKQLESDDWNKLFMIAHNQAVTGIFIDGVYHSLLRPDRDIWEKWVFHLFYLEQINGQITISGKNWVDSLNEVGFSASIFKGASVASWYPNPLHRSFGDIDIVISRNWDKLEPFLQTKNLKYHYETGDLVLDDSKAFSVEIHPRWDYFYNPIINQRFQKMFKVSDTISNELYFVCLIIHLRRHFLIYGIGLKQVCDVAMMLKAANLNFAKIAEILQELHIERFSRMLFGFIHLHFSGVGTYPLPPISKGKNFVLFENVILKDNYSLKLKQEIRVSHSDSPFIRIVRNSLFWSKRGFQLLGIMPFEMFFFLFQKIINRMKMCQLCGKKHL